MITSIVVCAFLHWLLNPRYRSGLLAHLSIWLFTCGSEAPGMLGSFPKFMPLEADGTQDGAQVRALVHILLNLTSDRGSCWGCHWLAS